MELLFALVLGLVIGSFLNVCIVRIPAGESISLPRSRCPRCRSPIAAYDNVPVLSWLILGGKCRNCREPISVRYPAIETLTGLLALLCAWQFGFTAPALLYFAFSASMIVLSFIDIDHRILPDSITLNGIWIGFVAAVVLGRSNLFMSRILGGFGFESTLLASAASSALGIVVGGGLLWLVGEAYFRFRGVEGMGFGDVKMMAMVGAWLGAPLALFTILIGSVLGSIIGLTFIRLAGKDNDYELPFGTFLGLGAVVAALYGEELLSMYLRLMQV